MKLDMGDRLQIGSETIEDTSSNPLSVDTSLIPTNNNNNNNNNVF
jgi:hypothetical protein